MKKSFPFLISVCLLGSGVKAQWVQQSSTTVANLTGISCLNSDTCFAAGASGNIRKTFNGGTTWSVTGSGSTFANLASIRMFDRNSIWIGLSQKLHHTANGGSTWSAVVPTTTAHTIFDLAFLNDSDYIAVGGSPSNTTSGGYVVATTANAGTSWSAVNLSGQPTMCGVQCLNGTDCIAAGGALTIYKSTDGGSTWVKKDSSTTATETYLDIHFPTPTVGFVAGGNITSPATGAVMKKTTDGGNTWTPVTLPFPGTIFGIHFVNADSGFTVGYAGQIWVTTDAGMTWAQQSSPVLTDLYKIEMLDAMTGYAVGTNGVILKTTNAGGGYILGSASGLADLPMYSLLGNPSKNDLIIETRSELFGAELSVYNAVGEKVGTIKNIQGRRINIPSSDYPGGLYFFTVRNNGIAFSGKFIVE